MPVNFMRNAPHVSEAVTPHQEDDCISLRRETVLLLSRAWAFLGNSASGGASAKMTSLVPAS